MYGIFTNIYPINDPNVGKYTIHGWSGICSMYRIVTYIWDIYRVNDGKCSNIFQRHAAYGWRERSIAHYESWSSGNPMKNERMRTLWLIMKFHEDSWSCVIPELLFHILNTHDQWGSRHALVIAVHNFTSQLSASPGPLFQAARLKASWRLHSRSRWSEDKPRRLIAEVKSTESTCLSALKSAVLGSIFHTMEHQIIKSSNFTPLRYPLVI